MIADLRLLPDVELDALHAEASALYAAALAELGITSEDEARRVLDLETADLIEELSRIEVFHPIAAASLWQAPCEQWDQRRIVCSLVHPLTLVFAGNRAGKTYAILEALVAFALGGDHPAVVAWLEDNDLPRDLIPFGPGECYAVANTASASIKIHRLDLVKLLPPTAYWRGLHAKDEAVVEIPVPGHEEPARIWLKSVDQPIGSYKGDEVRFVAISEEPKGEQGKLVLQECLRACSAVGGRVVIEMTPQDGFTWVWDDLVVKGEYQPHVVQIEDALLNTMVANPESHARWYASMSEEERRMRRFGRFVAREGLVYPRWSRGDGTLDGLGHVCEPFDIPDDWTRFRTTDFGQTTENGTGCLWFAVAPDGLVVIYREYYLAGEPSFREHARRVRATEDEAGDTDRIEAAVGDPASKQGREAFAEEGLGMGLANNDLEGGISACNERLLPRGDDGRPGLKVFRTCENFIREIEAYRRDPNRKDGRPLKKNDHLMDCWRYGERLIQEWYGVIDCW